MPLWLQMCGRGSRPHQNKTSFQIIDLGANSITHQDWNYNHDWKGIFFNSRVPKPGEAPMKICPSCGGMVHMSRKVCKLEYEKFSCLFRFPVKPPPPEIISQSLIVITDTENIQALIDKYSHYKPYAVPFRLLEQIKRKAANRDEALIAAELMFKKWLKLKGKRFTAWHKNIILAKITEPDTQITEPIH
jgi:hypothetical protein